MSIVKPLLVSTYDILGGAARSAYRLHQGLREIDVESKMIVQTKDSDSLDVYAPEGFGSKLMNRARVQIENETKKYFVGRSHSFSTSLLPTNIVQRISKMEGDVINLHWVAGGYVAPEDLPRFGKPIVWTLHDMWAFTGGCHYDENCGRYNNSCGECPMVRRKSRNDISRKLWSRRKKSWDNLNFKVVAPSRWLAEAALSSGLLKNKSVEIIPYGIDTDVFFPRDRVSARNKLNLPLDKKLILFVAFGLSDPRKGIQYFRSVIEQIKENRDAKDIEIVLLGPGDLQMIQKDFGLPVRSLGLVEGEENLSFAYSACDLFVAPSVQDNLPNTVIEATACGLPTIAFNIGGMPDIIDDQTNGFLIKPFDLEEFGSKILILATDTKVKERFALAARAKAMKEFPLRLQAQRYLKVYKEILG